MAENEDAGAFGFEDRIRKLFADGAADRAVSAKRVIDGARRRRVRHRATAAGSSLAVLGVAAGAVAFGGGHAAGRSAAVTPAASTTSPAPKTCSASVTGKVPDITLSAVDRLTFGTVSGTTAGIPWGVQIHVFPDKQSHLAWENKLPAGSIPQDAKDAEHPGAMAQFRTPGDPGYSEFGYPGGSDEQYFMIQQGRGLGTGTPVKPGTQALPKSVVVKDYPAYVTSGWMAPDVDHLCAQYADHAEFVPVYRIQGGAFYVLGYKDTDRPQKLIGYGSAGQVVGSGIAAKNGLPFDLLVPAPVPLDQQH